MWLLPALLLAAALVCSIPLSGYFAWLMDGKYRAPRVLKWFEDLVDTGPQDWKQYAIALVVFNIALFVFGFVVLCLQPIAPLNPRGLGILAPSTIFNTVISFMTNTNLQHYSGDQHLSNFSQIFFILPNMFSRRRSDSARWRRSSARSGAKRRSAISSSICGASPCTSTCRSRWSSASSSCSRACR
jgi:potassium-transporting ATPase potassium-binding subunit